MKLDSSPKIASTNSDEGKDASVQRTSSIQLEDKDGNDPEEKIEKMEEQVIAITTSAEAKAPISAAATASTSTAALSLSTNFQGKEENPQGREIEINNEDEEAATQEFDSGCMDIDEGFREEVVVIEKEEEA